MTSAQGLTSFESRRKPKLSAIAFFLARQHSHSLFELSGEAVNHPKAEQSILL